MLRNRISGDPYHLIRVHIFALERGAPERYCFLIS